MSYSTFSTRSGLLAVALSGAVLVSLPVAAAITLTLNDGSSSYSCTLSSLNVSSAGNVAANVSACTPALAGGGAGGDSGSGGGSTDDSSVGGGGTAPSEPPLGADGDPRVGLWSPDLSTSPVVYVADQSLDKGSATTVSRLPGCINGGSIDNLSSCGSRTSYSGTINGQPVTVSLTADQILSIRFFPSGVAQGNMSGTLGLTNSVGGNVGISTKVSLSTTPGQMDPPNPKCKVISSRTPGIALGKDYCPVTETGSIYYLNIQPLADCKGCTWRLEESSAVTVFKR